jgi:hypothetical protein
MSKNRGVPVTQMVRNENENLDLAHCFHKIAHVQFES